MLNSYIEFSACQGKRMYRYENLDGSCSTLNKTAVALIIMADPHGEHLVSCDDRAPSSWKNTPAIDEHIKHINSEQYEGVIEQKVLYAGPDIVGECTIGEVVARIVQDPQEVHLINQMRFHSSKLISWTSWTHLENLHRAVQRIASHIPPFKCQKLDIAPYTHVKLDSSRKSYSDLYRRREGAFEEIVEIFNPQIIHRSSKYLNGRALYAWGGIDCHPVWDRDVATESLGELIEFLITNLRSKTKIKLPGIGTLTLQPERKSILSFRMLPSFSKKLNGRIPIDPKAPLWTDGLHNISYWLPNPKNAQSALRQYAYFAHDPILCFLMAQHFFEFIAFWLWCGHHVTIPNFGTFKLRKGCQSYRTVRFKASKLLLRKLKGNQS